MFPEGVKAAGDSPLSCADYQKFWDRQSPAALRDSCKFYFGCLLLKLFHQSIIFIYFFINIQGYILFDEKNEMGGACGAYGGGESCAQSSGGET